MAAPTKARVGFVSAGSSSMPHYNSFAPLIPESIELDSAGLGLYGDSLYDVANKKDIIVRNVQELVEARDWHGVIVTAAPTELLNPGLFEDLKTALAVPFTTALHACVSALRAYSARRVLLLTPFDSRMNQLIRDHLQGSGISAVAPHPFEQLAVPKRMGPDAVFELAKTSLNAADPVDAIYFQGAVLDPIKVLEKIETNLGITAIASNPAMLWYLVSRLELAFPISGYGRLLREWPRLGESRLSG